MLKSNPWMYQIKGLSGEKIIGSFYEKELLLSKLPDSNKVKVLLDLPNYTNKKELC